MNADNNEKSDTSGYSLNIDRDRNGRIFEMVVISLFYCLC